MYRSHFLGTAKHPVFGLVCLCALEPDQTSSSACVAGRGGIIAVISSTTESTSSSPDDDTDDPIVQLRRTVAQVGRVRLLTTLDHEQPYPALFPDADEDGQAQSLVQYLAPAVLALVAGGFGEDDAARADARHAAGLLMALPALYENRPEAVPHVSLRREASAQGVKGQGRENVHRAAFTYVPLPFWIGADNDEQNTGSSAVVAEHLGCVGGTHKGPAQTNDHDDVPDPKAAAFSTSNVVPPRHRKHPEPVCGGGVPEGRDTRRASGRDRSLSPPKEPVPSATATSVTMEKGASRTPRSVPKPEHRVLPRRTAEDREAAKGVVFARPMIDATDPHVAAASAASLHPRRTSVPFNSSFL